MVRLALWGLALAVCARGVTAGAQEAVPPPPTTLAVRSNLVQVPALVTTKAGEIVYGLRAGDFVVTDNGVPQAARLEEDTDAEPLALAIVVETGGSGGGAPAGVCGARCSAGRVCRRGGAPGGGVEL